jgi:hypothetical protein
LRAKSRGSSLPSLSASSAPVEQRPHPVGGIGDEAVQRHRHLHDHCGHANLLVGGTISTLFFDIPLQYRAAA